jgi:26S proteasome regulatory subunit N10
MGDNGFEFGVKPEVDPELALALRMSYEEEKARQEREKKAQEKADKEKLGAIPEGDEKQPLLSEEKDSEEASGSKPADKKKDDDKDKMDTA